MNWAELIKHKYWHLNIQQRYTNHQLEHFIFYFPIFESQDQSVVIYYLEFWNGREYQHTNGGQEEQRGDDDKNLKWWELELVRYEAR